MIAIKKQLYFFPLILLCFFYVYKSYHFIIHDYANYYFGGLFLQKGIFKATTYFPYQFNKTIADLGYQNIFVSYAPNTPFLAIFFWIFSFLKIGISKLLFNCISSVLFLVAIYRLSIYFKLHKYIILLIPIVFFVPIKNNLLLGQVYFLLFFLLSEGFLAYQKKQFKTFGFFWSVAIFLKVFPILFLFFLLFKKDFKAIVYVTISCSILLIFSICINGLDTWLFYISNVLNRAGNGEIAGAFVDNYQSFFMFFKRLFVFEDVHNKTPIINAPKLFYSLVLFIKLFLFGLGFFITKKNKNSLVVFSFWVLVSILISPYGSTYSFLILLFLFFALTNKEFNFKHKKTAELLLFLISNSYVVPKLNFPFNYARLFFLVALFVVLIWNFKNQIPFRKVVLIMLFISIIYAFFKEETTSIKTLFKTPILTYDYQLKSDKIKYSYWNENGENQLEKEYNYNRLDSTNINITNNQIFYKNKQITFDHSNKKKPILINGEKIIFLSDIDNGIGFYSIKHVVLP